jgi:hypothetical protein
MKATDELVTVTINVNCGCGFRTSSVEAARQHVANTGHKMVDGRVAVVPTETVQARHRPRLTNADYSRMLHDLNGLPGGRR